MSVMQCGHIHCILAQWHVTITSSRGLTCTAEWTDKVVSKEVALKQAGDDSEYKHSVALLEAEKESTTGGECVLVMSHQSLRCAVVMC